MYTRIIVIRMSGFRSHKESQSVLFLKSPNPYINLFDRDLAVYMSIPYSLRITYNLVRKDVRTKSYIYLFKIHIILRMRSPDHSSGAMFKESKPMKSCFVPQLYMIYFLEHHKNGHITLASIKRMALQHGSGLYTACATMNEERKEGKYITSKDALESI